MPAFTAAASRHPGEPLMRFGSNLSLLSTTPKRDRKHWTLALTATFAISSPLLALGEVYSEPQPGSALIGELKYTKPRYEDTLIDVARDFGLGQDEIVMANPTVDRYIPSKSPQVLLPTRYILPDTPHTGIVLNVPEMRLYYYASSKSAEAGSVYTFPVSVGRMDWRTPLGTTKVIQKVKDPVWRPPESIKREHAAEGDPLPDAVLPGPKNPLGKFALKLGVLGYLIHGTSLDSPLGLKYDKSFAIGMRVTHGCVRMYNEDIERFWPMIPVGTPVHIVDQPVKAGWDGESLMIEVHPGGLGDDEALPYEKLIDRALDAIGKTESGSRSIALDNAALKQALKSASGVPTAVGKASPPTL